jgi:hypothetical protein
MSEPRRHREHGGFWGESLRFAGFSEPPWWETGRRRWYYGDTENTEKHNVKILAFSVFSAPP